MKLCSSVWAEGRPSEGCMRAVISAHPWPLDCMPLATFVTSGGRKRIPACLHCCRTCSEFQNHCMFSLRCCHLNHCNRGGNAPCAHLRCKSLSRFPPTPHTSSFPPPPPSLPLFSSRSPSALSPCFSPIAPHTYPHFLSPSPCFCCVVLYCGMLYCV